MRPWIPLVLLALFALLPEPAAAQVGAKQTAYAFIRCESPGGRSSFCPADTRRGLALALSAAQNRDAEPTRFGVFRM